MNHDDTHPTHPDGIHPTRTRVLNDRPVDPAGQYVLYWMQQSMRTRYNHALAAAIARANALGRPLVACFGLMDDYPEANERHYAFMLEGLRDVRAALAEMGIAFHVRHGPPYEAALHLAPPAAMIVCDRGYLRHQRAWRDRVAAGAACRVIEVESDAVVPVETASPKQEFAARTIRPKIGRLLDTYLVPMLTPRPEHPSTRLRVAVDRPIDVSDPAAALARLKVDRGVKASPFFHGGERAAQTMLARFVEERLAGYGEHRNEPAADATSHLSMYLHFGQVSALDVALRARDATHAPQADREKFLEELIVRRELAINFVYYNADYDRYACLPAWAKQTLDEQRGDVRERLYTREQLEAGRTADAYWNAAQLEMVRGGFMQNSMRMYWGKQIIGWSRTPEEAFETTLYLNNKYFLCGRDAISYASVAWVFGLHDRPWGPRRKVFGTVRFMNAGGLKRKFDIEGYVRKVEAMKGRAAG